MLDKFLLWSGNPIPLPSIQTFIHQPKMKDLSLINEMNFMVAIKLLSFQKGADAALKDKSNFEIFLSIINNPKMADSKAAMLMLFSLLFPDFKVNLEDRILLVNMNDKEKPIRFIDERCFDDFAIIIKEIFKVKDDNSEIEFNPANKQAEEIAKLIQKSRMKVAKEKGMLKDDNVSLLEHYSKILCVNGYTPIDVNNMTLYQVYGIIDMIRNKVTYEGWFSAKLQGAKDLDDVNHWMNI